MASDELIRIYVGADRSQALAVSVLEYSIRRHTSAPVEVIPMLDLPVPTPKDPRNGQRTGFSFSRFCIPRLAGYRGKAIYMDADMLVFRDIRELWNIDFDGAKVVIQQEVKFEEATTQKVGAPKKRKKQCAVMLLDCDRLNWDIAAIVGGLDAGAYDYEQLMYDLCILDEADVKYGVPFEWNSLEHWDKDTRLIHYTDVYTQPWTACGNRFGQLWYDEVRRMLNDGALDAAALRREIELGYFRPSLLRDVRFRYQVPTALLALWDRTNTAADRLTSYVPHKLVYEAKRLRQKAIKQYEAGLRAAQPATSGGSDKFDVHLGGNDDARNILIFTEHVNATYFISFDIPLRELYKEGAVNFAVVAQARVAAGGTGCWERWLDTIAPAVVVFTRYGQPYGAEILASCQRRSIPAIYHIDDDLLELPAELGREIQQRQGASDIVAARRHLLANCDLIYASTAHLRDILQSRFPQQRFAQGIYAPFIDSVDAAAIAPARGYPVIGYMGSKGHQHDLELVVPALEQLLDERPELHFEVFGTIKLPPALLRFGKRVRSHSVQQSYAEFLRSLATLHWDIGLAPLVDSPFNRCKAPTKFIEYSASGIPVVASRVAVYADVMPPGGGVIVDGDWHAALARFLDHPAARAEAARIARAHCSATFSKQILQHQLIAIFESALALETT